LSETAPTLANGMLALISQLSALPSEELHRGGIDALSRRDEVEARVLKRSRRSS
jgi:hypothetical protein